MINICLFLHKYMCCGYSLEVPQHMFSWINKIKMNRFRLKNKPYLELYTYDIRVTKKKYFPPHPNPPKTNAHCIYPKYLDTLSLYHTHPNIFLPADMFNTSEWVGTSVDWSDTAYCGVWPGSTVCSDLSFQYLACIQYTIIYCMPIKKTELGQNKS